MKVNDKSNLVFQSIWYNPNITIVGKVIFYRQWYDGGIKIINDLLQDDRFLTYNDFIRKYNIRTNFLKYHGLIGAIKSYFSRLQITNIPKGL